MSGQRAEPISEGTRGGDEPRSVGRVCAIDAKHVKNYTDFMMELGQSWMAVLAQGQAAMMRQAREVSENVVDASEARGRRRDRPPNRLLKFVAMNRRIQSMTIGARRFRPFGRA